MNYFFTADTHFNHQKILDYCSRPFSTIEEMNETLITNWNNRVQKGDIVYHLGDFGFTRKLGLDPFDAMKALLKRLNGQINLVLGNHDCQNYNQRILSLFASNSLLKEKSINGIRIIMCHYPILSWAGRNKGSIMLHGHSHYNIKITQKDSLKLGKILDVGVDGNSFNPYSFDEIMDIMSKKPLNSTIPEMQDNHPEIELT